MDRIEKKITSAAVSDSGNFRDRESGCLGLYGVERFINKKPCSGYSVDGWLMVLSSCTCAIAISHADSYSEEKSS